MDEGIGGTHSVLYVFVGPDGSGPQGVLLDGLGNTYGTTAWGGAQNAGTVFQLSPAGQLTTLYTFTGVADGGQPHAGLIRDSAGNFYGTTFAGGIVNDACFLGWASSFNSHGRGARAGRQLLLYLGNA